MFNSVIHVLSGHGRIPAHRAFMGLNSFYYSSLEYFFVLFFFFIQPNTQCFLGFYSVLDIVSTLCWTLWEAPGVPGEQSRCGLDHYSLMETLLFVK